jgi:general secretion pathway protein B
MSYILDALKKSDQQRQRGVTPTLLTAQTMTTEPERPRLLPAGVLAALLIATGIVIGWLRPWQPVPPIAVPETGTMKPAAPPPVQPSPSVAEAMAPSASAVAKQPGAVPADPAQRPALPQAVPLTPGESAMPDQDKATQPRPSDAAQEKEAVAMHELPPSIQREIPAIVISFHIYSSLPGERRVMINGEMARQGDFLTPGLSIEQITPDGVILGYKGYRIRRGLR